MRQAIQTEKQVRDRIANLPQLAAALFKRGRDGERVRTVMMKADISAEALSAFAPLAATADETRERLDYLTDQWTGAIKQILVWAEVDLFKEHLLDILVPMSGEQDFLAVTAERSDQLVPIGSGVYRYFKIKGVAVKAETKGAKEARCLKVADDVFLKMTFDKDDKNDKTGRKAKRRNIHESAGYDSLNEGSSDELVWRLSGFKAQRLFGYLYTLYWADAGRTKKRVGRLEYDFAQNNSHRVRAKWLKNDDVWSGAGEALLGKVAEMICSFLEKYYSVQPEVERFNRSVANAIARTRKLLGEHEAGISETARQRLSDWREAAAAFKPCDGRDPQDVERLVEWVTEYNMRTNELRQLLPKDWFEENGEAHERRALEKLGELKGYPSWPDYKPDSAISFQAKSVELRDMAGHPKLTAEQIRTWVERTWLNGEVHHLDYLATRHSKKTKKDLPLRKKVAREIFARTGGKLVRGEMGSGRVKWSISWAPDGKRLEAVASGVVIRALKEYEAVSEHAKRVPNDFSAVRRQVDVLVTLVNLKAETLPAAERANYLAAANRLAGDAKGALLSLAEGSKEEIQISGFSLKAGKGGEVWSLRKNACLAVAGDRGGKERLALLFDPSGDKEDPVRIDAKSSGILRLIGYSGGADKRDSTEQQKVKNLVAGGAVGGLGSYGLVLPLQFGSSQSRRYFYPHNGHREDGVVGAMIAGKVGIGNARIIKKTGHGGKIEHFVALSVRLPRPELDSRAVAPKGFIGVDRGENHLAVMAETDMAGRLIGEPSLYGSAAMNRVGRAYEKTRQSQSQMKRLEGGDWFEARTTNAVRLIAIKAVKMMLENERAVVFEDLSRGFARGGTASWEHQYTKVEDRLKDVLDFCGLKTKEIYHYTDKNKDQGHVWFGKVGAAYTSQTCPACGSIWGKPEIDRDRDKNIVIIKWDERHAPRPSVLRAEIRPIGKGWQLLWPDGTKMILPSGVAQITAAFAKVSNKASEEAKRAERVLLGWLNHRPRNDYERFRCRYCGVSLHADKVGALNIARKAIFQKTRKVEKRKRDDWQKWYLETLASRDLSWWNKQARSWLQ